MRTTMELYGLDPKELIGIPYEKALKIKLQGARGRLRELVEEFGRLAREPMSEEVRQAIQRNNHMQSDVYRAIQFTELLLMEIEL